MVWPNPFIKFPFSRFQFRLSIFISRDEIKPSLKICHFIPYYVMGQKNVWNTREINEANQKISHSISNYEKVRFLISVSTQYRRSHSKNVFHHWISGIKITYKNIQYQNTSPSDLSAKITVQYSIWIVALHDFLISEI